MKEKIQQRIKELEEHSIYLLRENNKNVEIMTAKCEARRQCILEETVFLEKLITP